MSERRRCVLFCTLSLVVGAALYILFRQHTHVGALCGQWPELRPIQDALEEGPWNLFRYYLPDMLWSVSLSCGMLAIFGTEKRWIYGGSGFFFGCVWELLQWLGIVEGTADSLDVLMYLAGSFLCIIVNKRRV